MDYKEHEKEVRPDSLKKAIGFLLLALTIIVLILLYIARSPKTGTVSDTMDSSSDVTNTDHKPAPEADYLNIPISLIAAGQQKSARFTEPVLADYARFDRYDDRILNIKAERFSKLIVSTCNLKSGNKENLLFPVGVFEYNNRLQALTRVADMRYYFSSWSSHACYIGLYHDRKNDFKYADSIDFTLFAEIADSVTEKKNLYVIAYTGPELLRFYISSSTDRSFLSTLPPFIPSPGAVRDTLHLLGIIRQQGK